MSAGTTLLHELPLFLDVHIINMLKNTVTSSHSSQASFEESNNLLSSFPAIELHECPLQILEQSRLVDLLISIWEKRLGQKIIEHSIQILYLQHK